MSQRSPLCPLPCPKPRGAGRMCLEKGLPHTQLLMLASHSEAPISVINIRKLLACNAQVNFALRFPPQEQIFLRAFGIFFRYTGHHPFVIPDFTALQQELAAARQAVISTPTGVVCGQGSFCITGRRSCGQVIRQVASKQW